MDDSDTSRILPSLLALIPDTHISDYSYLNIIDLHVANIERELIALDAEDSDSACRTILAVWRRMRRYYEMRGRYKDGIRFAPIFRHAAQRLSLKADAAWILLKDEVWLRILDGQQNAEVSRGFEQAMSEMRELYEHGATSDERRDGGIGLYTAYRYVVGYLRHLQGRLLLPNSHIVLTREAALKKCEEVLQVLEADDVFAEDDLGTFRARLEQTAGNVAFGNGDAPDALSHYNRAAELFAKHAPEDDEHLAIVKCFQAQGHIALAELIFNRDRYRGANRFSAEFRNAKRDASGHLAEAIELLHEAYLHAACVGWAEGDPRISEHMARAFLHEGRVNLSIMFAERSLEGYRRLGNKRHVGRVESLVDELRIQGGSFSAHRIDCDILVVGRMREQVDSERLLAIQELCKGIRRDTLPIHAQRVDELVDRSGGRITDALIDALWSAEIVVAILDGLSPNVLYEVGIAHGRGKPVVLCLSEDEQTEAVPFDLKDYHIVRFRSLAELTKRILATLLDELRAAGHNVTGPVTLTFP